MLNKNDVLELIDYEPKSGKLFWKERGLKWFSDGKQPKEYAHSRWNGRYAGKEAFTTINSNGYRHGTLLKKTYPAHMIIGIILFGKQVLLDHVNGNRLDNSLENLALSTNGDNARNRSLSKNNTSGQIGVYWHNTANKWCARIEYNKKLYHLGLFHDFSDAVIARKEAEKKFNFGKTHGRAPLTTVKECVSKNPEILETRWIP